MIETAENLRREYAIARGEQDEFSVRSHQRAAAQAAGRFVDEIVPVTVKGRKGDTRDLLEYLDDYHGEVHVVGDAGGFHTLMQAIHDGDRVGRAI